jgi:uncharacterized membrane protein
MVSQLPGRRLAGIDAARGLALFGMMATHVFHLYQAGTGEPTWAALAFSGRASALFAVVAGTGLALLTGGNRVHGRQQLSADRLGIAVRAVLIALVGLVLGGLEVDIAVILFHYGVLFLCALPFVSMPLRTLAWWAGGWTLLSPVAAYLLRPAVRETVTPPQVGGNIFWEDFSTPWTVLADVTITGYYPVLQWLSYVLIGLAIGRLALTDTAVQLGLLSAGLALAAGSKVLSRYLMGPQGGMDALLQTPEGRRWPLERMMDASLTGVDQSGSWWWLAASAPHSASPLDLAHTAGTAAAAVGLCLLLAGRLPSAMLVLAAPGALTLSLYTMHVWAMSMVQMQATAPEPALVYWTQVAAALALGWLFHRLNARGPLELVVSGAATAARTGKRAPV